jgi:pimeloyl-ACP methyl ester carboxylesterase
MEAPSSYHEPSKNIRIFVRKFKHSPKAIEKNHFIFLNGGPGGYGDQDYWGEIKTLLNGNNGAVCYTMDHRGAGFSEMATSLPLEDVVERFETFARQAPFPVKHLTMTNAALDVAMFVKSIQAATSPKSTNLYAISYGAELAHHVVQLCPDLIDHAFLAGMPSLPNNRHSPDSGIIQACEMDPTCRRYFGNVAQTIPLILDRIADATTNFCTAQLSHLVKGFNTGDRIEIGRSVFRQVLQKSKKFGHIAKYEPIMGALLFLKATSDCRRPDQYKSLLKWLWKEPPMNGRGPSDRRESADWVYLMINYDVDVAKIHKDLADNQPKLLGRAYTSCRMPAYFDRIKHHFKHWQRSKVTSIKTTKTHLHYMHGLLDIPTPVEPAFERYQQDVAPVKSWLLLDYRGHDGCPQKCLDLWIQTAFADKDMSVVKECIIRDKKQYELDWSLKTLAEGWRIIDQISEAPKPASRPTSLRIPYYMQSVQPDL